MFRRKLMQASVLFAAVAMLMFLLTASAQACSDVQLSDDQGDVISVRTMDFDVDLKSDLKIVPRGQKMATNAPDGKQGIRWTSQYGFVGVNALDLDKYNDGLNEKGLSVATLWLPISEYPKPASPETALSIQDVAAWVMGNFATVDEVKAGLKNVTVWGEYSKEIQAVPPLHLAVHDAQGKNLVVEFVKGEMNMYDNPNGVLTNEPEFSWHLADLDIFKTHRVDMGIAPSGLYSSARFVLLSQLRDALAKPKTNQAATQFAMNLIARVSVIPGERGEAKADTQSSLMPYGSTYTQWTVVRDHKNLIFHYKTTLNASYRAVDLKRVDFSAGQPIKTLSMDGDGADLFQDMTGKFK